MITLDHLFQLPGLQGRSHQEVFKDIPYLSQLTPHQFHILKGQLVLKEARKGETIFQKGDYDSSMYLLLIGKVNLYQEANIPLVTLSPGAFFGVSAAIAGSPHSATAQATQDSLILEIPFQAILQWKRLQPAFKKELDRIYLERALIRQLKGVPLFSSLPLELLEELKNHVRLTEYPKDTTIVHQGYRADTFYLLRQGIVVVTKKLKDREITIAYLKGGQFFGEMGLLEDRVRQASVKAQTDVACVELDKETFQAIYQANPAFRKIIHHTIQERRGELVLGTVQPLVAEGLLLAKVGLIIDLRRCIFCYQCVDACQAYYGVPRIKLEGKVIRSFLFPHACYHCEDPVCMLCPIGAIRRGEKGEIHILPFCNGCGYCADACPFGVIQMKDKIAHKCDLCRDLKRQACIHHCPTRAIQLRSPEDLFH